MDRVLIAALVISLAGVATALWRSRPARTIHRINPDDFGLTGKGLAVAGFTAPMCHSCQLWREQLEAHGVEPSFVDVKERPELAREYGIRTTPMILLVGRDDGRVHQWFTGDPQPRQVEELHAAVQPAVH